MRSQFESGIKTKLETFIHTHTHCTNSNPYATPDYIIMAGLVCLRKQHRMFRSLAHALYLVLRALIK